MSNKLTYKKVFVDSRYRLPSSNSSSDFVIELDTNMECPADTKCWITEVSIPASWKTTEINFYEYFYYMLYNDSGVLIRNGRVYLGNAIYFAEQFSDDIVTGLNNDVRDLNSDNDIFVYAYSASTRTVSISVADGLNFRLKVPTDNELSNYVNGTWNTTSAPYDNRDPKSINYLLSNFVATNGGLSVWTSSYLNLVPFRSVFIHSPELSDNRYASPANYSSNIVKKVMVDSQLGGVINDVNTQFHEDWIDVSNKNLKRLSFRITSSDNKQMNLYDLDVQFSIVFSNPNF